MVVCSFTLWYFLAAAEVGKGGIIRVVREFYREEMSNRELFSCVVLTYMASGII